MLARFLLFFPAQECFSSVCERWLVQTENSAIPSFSPIIGLMTSRKLFRKWRLRSSDLKPSQDNFICDHWLFCLLSLSLVSLVGLLLLRTTQRDGAQQEGIPLPAPNFQPGRWRGTRSFKPFRFGRGAKLCGCWYVRFFFVFGDSLSYLNGGVLTFENVQRRGDCDDRVWSKKGRRSPRAGTKEAFFFPTCLLWWNLQNQQTPAIEALEVDFQHVLHLVAVRIVWEFYLDYPLRRR